MTDSHPFSKDDVANTMMAFYNVRKGGPKDKRLRRVELMGEHTPKPLYYIKVAQSVDTELVPVPVLAEDMQRLFGDIGDIYRPLDVETGKEREFCIIGYFDKKHALNAVTRMSKGEFRNGVTLTVELCKHWFVDLYPRPKAAPLTDYKRMVILQDP